MTKCIWKQEKEDYLREHWNKVTLKELAKYLHASENTIKKKAEELGLPIFDNGRWSEEEVETLVRLVKTYPIMEISTILNRSDKAVRAKAKRLGLDYIILQKEFLPEELNYIRSNWGKISVTDIARELKVSRIIVQRQANLMNLPKLGKNPYRKWTPGKIEKLRKLAKTKTSTELAKYFKTSKKQIHFLSQKYKIKLIDEKIRWTKEENEFLRTNASTLDINEIARILNKRGYIVRSQAEYLGIKVKESKAIWTSENTETFKELVKEGKTILEIMQIMDKAETMILRKAKEFGIYISPIPDRLWTAEDTILLCELASSKKVSELVVMLARSSNDIRKKAKELNISLLNDFRPWSDDEIKQLYEFLEEGKTTVEIAEIFGRTENAVRKKIFKLGLENQEIIFRRWTEEDDETLSDLWGSMAIEKLAKKFNRTEYAIKIRAAKLGLGPQLMSNYDGISIPELCTIFNVTPNVIDINWLALGLKIKTRNISNYSSYRYVEINDLLEFLEKNQNIWDSRCVEVNIFGKEPVWLQEKRKSDVYEPANAFWLKSMTMQQMILAGNFYIPLASEDAPIIDESMGARTRSKGGDK